MKTATSGVLRARDIAGVFLHAHLDHCRTALGSSHRVVASLFLSCPAMIIGQADTRHDEGLDVREYLEEILKDIERSLGPTYRLMGLELEWLATEVDVVISFRDGELTFSPLEIVFPPFRQESETATWADAALTVHCYEPLDIGSENHRFWSYAGLHVEYLSGSGEEILERLRNGLEAYGVIDIDGSKLLGLWNENLAFAQEVVQAFCAKEDIMVEKDTQKRSENLIFTDCSDRLLTVAFPLDEEKPAILRIDNRRVATFEQTDREQLQDLLRQAFRRSAGLSR